MKTTVKSAKMAGKAELQQQQQPQGPSLKSCTGCMTGGNMLNVLAAILVIHVVSASKAFLSLLNTTGKFWVALVTLVGFLICKFAIMPYIFSDKLFCFGQSRSRKDFVEEESRSRETFKAVDQKRSRSRSQKLDSTLTEKLSDGSGKKIKSELRRDPDKNGSDQKSRGYEKIAPVPKKRQSKSISGAVVVVDDSYAEESRLVVKDQEQEARDNYVQDVDEEDMYNSDKEELADEDPDLAEDDKIGSAKKGAINVIDDGDPVDEKNMASPGSIKGKIKKVLGRRGTRVFGEPRQEKRGQNGARRVFSQPDQDNYREQDIETIDTQDNIEGQTMDNYGEEVVQKRIYGSPVATDDNEDSDKEQGDQRMTNKKKRRKPLKARVDALQKDPEVAQIAKGDKMGLKALMESEKTPGCCENFWGCSCPTSGDAELNQRMASDIQLLSHKLCLGGQCLSEAANRLQFTANSMLDDVDAVEKKSRASSGSIKGRIKKAFGGRQVTPSKEPRQQKEEERGQNGFKQVFSKPDENNDYEQDKPVSGRQQVTPSKEPRQQKEEERGQNGFKRVFSKPDKNNDYEQDKLLSGRQVTPSKEARQEEEDVGPIGGKQAFSDPDQDDDYEQKSAQDKDMISSLDYNECESMKEEEYGVIQKRYGTPIILDDDDEDEEVKQKDRRTKKQKAYSITPTTSYSRDSYESLTMDTSDEMSDAVVDDFDVNVYADDDTTKEDFVYTMLNKWGLQERYAVYGMPVLKALSCGALFMFLIQLFRIRILDDHGIGNVLAIGSFFVWKIYVAGQKRALEKYRLKLQYEMSWPKEKL